MASNNSISFKYNINNAQTATCYKRQPISEQRLKYTKNIILVCNTNSKTKREGAENNIFSMRENNPGTRIFSTNRAMNMNLVGQNDSKGARTAVAGPNWGQSPVRCKGKEEVEK